MDSQIQDLAAKVLTLTRTDARVFAVISVGLFAATKWLLGPGAEKFAWLKAIKEKPLYAFATPVVLAVVSGLATAATSGAAFSPELVLGVVFDALKLSGGAMFTFLAHANGKEHVAIAKEAGAKAAAEVKSVDAAIAELGKDPLKADTKP